MDFNEIFSLKMPFLHIKSWTILYTPLYRYDLLSGVPAPTEEKKRVTLAAPIEKINLHVAGGNILPLQVKGDGGTYFFIHNFVFQ